MAPLFFSLFSVILFSLVSAQNTTNNIVDLGYAKFKGQYDALYGFTTYFGLRYAQPPVGNLRFRAPVNIEGSNYYGSTVVQATSPGPECIQGSPVAGSEDCLLLDVIVPSKPVSDSLPVMFQIHGGGYTEGNAESSPGFAMVNRSQAIVYVQIQYRLAALGFSSSREIRQNGVPNAGLLDQRSAMQWVQRNIAAFGGDPSRVTIVGGSAGGGSVMNQMIMYGGESNPPFRGAIAEYPWWQPYHNNSFLESQYKALLAASNCTDLTCLRSVSADVLGAASIAVAAGERPVDYGFGNTFWGPSVDGTIIQDLPTLEFTNGHFTKVPLLVDHDGYEGVDFTTPNVETTSQETTDLEYLFPTARPAFFTKLFNLYPSSSFNSTFFQRAQIFGDFIINCPTFYMSVTTTYFGVPTWKLIFDAGSELHSATAPFLYSIYPADNNNNTLADIMKDWFLSFAINLDPNVQSFSNATKPYWPQYGGNANIMDVNYTMIGVERDPDNSLQCDFFEAHGHVVEN